MTARRPKQKPPAWPTPLFDAVCADLGQSGLGPPRVADALLPSLTQLEPLP